MKQPPYSYKTAYERVAGLIGYPVERHTKMVAIEGLPGAGKSSFASWLAWQIGMPTIHLDLFLVPNDGGEILWRESQIAEAIEGRVGRKGAPFIVEGVFAFSVLEKLGFRADVRIFVENATNAAEGALIDQMRARCAGEDFLDSVDITIRWTEHLETVEEARDHFQDSLRKWLS